MEGQRSIVYRVMAINKKKPPQLGDYIEHTCQLNGRFEGKVVEILAMQFIYETPEGHSRFCLFREDWNHIKESKNER